MTRINDILNSISEGINDKHKYKAIFTAGGPGSGKSIISSMLFGVDKDSFVSPFGVKVVNSDKFFEKQLAKNGLSFIIDSKKDEYKKQMEVRGIAKELTNVQTGEYINGMLPMIVDGTGRDYARIKKQAEMLKNYGYDVSMIFVNTSLDTALERNQNRKRVVPEKIVTDSWRDVQNNIGKFQSYFGQENFVVIDNDKAFEPKSAEAKIFTDRLFKKGTKIFNKPIKNPIGKAIIKTLELTGGKYLSDLGKKDIKFQI